MIQPIHDHGGVLPKRAEPERNFVDRAINATIDQFWWKLTSRERQTFDTDFTTLGERIDEICRRWGISEEAVALRSLHVVRYLEGVVTRDKGDETRRDYSLPVFENDFWHNVDATTEANFVLLAHQEYDIDVETHRIAAEPLDGNYDEEMVMGEFPGYRLLRRSIGRIVGDESRLVEVQYISETTAQAEASN